MAEKEEIEVKSLGHEKELSEEDFKKLGKDSAHDFEKEKDTQENDLKTAYRNIIDLLQTYCDLNPDYYPLIACWIIGTYSHHDFKSYPYLFLNAMRGSGKSRTLRLITDLSKDGEVQMSMTEAVLFRTQGTLGIDEFEAVGRRGMENLRELLNASYKKGTFVKRMKQKKTEVGVEMVVEKFDVYRPIIMANIWGMEEVLSDRCITLILEKSNNPHIIKLAEIWNDEIIFQKTKKTLESVQLCSSDVIGKCYQDWNNYIKNSRITNNTTNNTSAHTTHTIYNTHLHTTTHNYAKLFKRLNSLDLDGRSVELSLPLLVIGWSIGTDVFENLYVVVEKYLKEKKEDQFAESQDISFIDYVAQETEVNWIMVKEVTENFKQFLQYDEKDEWLNVKWVGQALRRLKLRKDHKRGHGGVKVVLDIEKAQVRIQMFK